MHIEKRVGGTLVILQRASELSCDERRGFDTCRRLSSAIDTTSHRFMMLPIRTKDRKGDSISVIRERLSKVAVFETNKHRVSMYGAIVGYC